jgi:glycosyltransferase involved in cell wall biosynthesis
MRMAVVHEWIDAYAGSEQVFEAMAAVYPDADLYALSRESTVDLDVGGREIKTTFLDHEALRNRRNLTLPLMPTAWRAVGKGQYDVVLTSHHAFAHTNRLAEGGTHLCYVHSPARYIWTPEIDARGAATVLGPARSILRAMDRRAVGRVKQYAANSSAVAARIQEFWGRDATVIHPPVRVEYFGAGGDSVPTRDFVLGVGRWIPYKNLHLVIEAADIAGLPVKIAGRGPDKSRLIAAAAAASVPVELIEAPDDFELRELYRNALCLVYPTVEDFGIVPVEAQAAGTPVVALAEGGVLDTVRPEFSGFLVDRLSAQELASMIHKASSLEAVDCKSNSMAFGRAQFDDHLSSWVSRAI